MVVMALAVVILIVVMLMMVMLTVRLGPVQQQRLPYMSSVVCPWPALPLPVLTN